jgi:hypothetical protein
MSLFERLILGAALVIYATGCAATITINQEAAADPEYQKIGPRWQLAITGIMAIIFWPIILLFMKIREAWS